MLKLYIQSPQTLLEAQYIPDASMCTFIHYLEDNGYSLRTIREYLGAVIHFARWQHQQSCSCTAVTILDKVNFIKLHLPNCQCHKTLTKDKKYVPQRCLIGCEKSFSVTVRQLI
jgi:hypothetical protein